MPNEQIFFKNYTVFCISMQFGTFVDLTEKFIMQKKLEKLPLFVEL